MRPARLAAALLAAAALGAAAWSLRPGRAVEVVIPSGQTAAQTAVLLRARGVVRSTRVFCLWARATGLDRRLKPGCYRLRAGMAPWSLAAALAAGGEGVKIVVPEGFSARQIAERLEGAGVCPAEDFARLAREGLFEGYFFPTTYFFEPGTEADAVARRMRQEFRRRVEPEYARVQPRPRLTLHQALTLASIVEREAVRKAEQPMIAAVYLNRMRIRMRLQADPTVQYALGYWKKGLTSKDLAAPSPYNTYLHYGLPPGPICSPGLEAFQAVLNPAATPALYFVADHSGGHVFSDNAEQHAQAKRSFKRVLLQEKRRLRAEGRL
ncbi:MAG: endolytic transglycosylase MltG [Elusimicrobia bacterium]|nr:endolytic transglycosylase MltG [Elusimicrobiota bacterium]